jgi:hypothetical protein
VKKNLKTKISAKRKLTDTEKLYIQKNREKEKLYKKLEQIVNATNEFQERIINEQREAAILTAQYLEKQMRLIQKMMQLIDELLADKQTPKRDKILLSTYKESWYKNGSPNKMNSNAEEDKGEADFEDLGALFESIFGDVLEEEEKKQEAEAQNRRINEEQADEESPGSWLAEAKVEKQEIRKLYIKLANLFHPDKALDTEVQARNAEIMKQLNKAYQERNYQQLLILEKQFSQTAIVTQRALLELNEQIDEAKLLDLDAQIEKLKQQIEKAKIKKKNLEKSEEGKFVKEIDKNLKNALPKFYQMELEFKEIFAELEHSIKILEKYKVQRKSSLLTPLYSEFLSGFAL